MLKSDVQKLPVGHTADDWAGDILMQGLAKSPGIVLSEINAKVTLTFG